MDLEGNGGRGFKRGGSEMGDGERTKMARPYERNERAHHHQRNQKDL